MIVWRTEKDIIWISLKHQQFIYASILSREIHHNIWMSFYFFIAQKKLFRKDNKRFPLKVVLLITLKKIFRYIWIYYDFFILRTYNSVSYLVSCLWSFENLWPAFLSISAIKNSVVCFKFVRNIFILINVILFFR